MRTKASVSRSLIVAIIRGAGSSRHESLDREDFETSKALSTVVPCADDLGLELAQVVGQYAEARDVSDSLLACVPALGDDDGPDGLTLRAGTFPLRIHEERQEDLRADRCPA